MNTRQWSFFLLPLWILFVTGCATKGPGNSTASSPMEINSYIISEARKRITIAAPAEMDEGVRLIIRSQTVNSKAGRDLLFVASKLYGTLYPLYEKPDFTAIPPEGSVFPNLFNMIEKGIYPDISGANTSFLSFLLSPLAALFTDDRETLARSEEACERAAAMDPKSVIPPFVLGAIAERRGDADRALGYFSTVMAMDRSCYPALLAVARLKISRGDYQEGFLLLQEIEGQYGGNPEIFRLLAEVYLARGELKSAYDYTDKGLALEENMDLFFLRARVLLMMGDYTKSLQMLRIVERKKPPFPEFYVVKAAALEPTDSGRAKETVEYGLTLFPDNPQLLTLYGDFLISTGDENRGIRILQDLYSRYPGDHEVASRLVRVYLERGELRNAADILQDMDIQEISYDLLAYGYKVYDQLKDKAETLRYAETMYRRNNSDPSFVFPYIEQLIERNDSADAQKIIKDELEKTGDSRVRSRLLYLEASLKDSAEEQVPLLQEALFENLHNLEALELLADIYADQGDYRKAYRYIKQAAALDPEDSSLSAKEIIFRDRIR